MGSLNSADKGSRDWMQLHYFGLTSAQSHCSFLGTEVDAPRITLSVFVVKGVMGTPRLPLCVYPRRDLPFTIVCCCIVLIVTACVCLCVCIPASLSVILIEITRSHISAGVSPCMILVPCVSQCVCLFPLHREGVRVIRRTVCFSRLCLSGRLIIDGFHYGSFLRRRREGGGDEIAAPLSTRAAKNHSAGLQSKLFLGNPAP